MSKPKATLAEVKVDDPGGGWLVVSGTEVSGPYHRQREARWVARRLVKERGGGEILVRSRSGEPVDRQSVPTG